MYPSALSLSSACHAKKEEPFAVPVNNACTQVKELSSRAEFLRSEREKLLKVRSATVCVMEGASHAQCPFPVLLVAERIPEPAYFWAAYCRTTGFALICIILQVLASEQATSASLKQEVEVLSAKVGLVGACTLGNHRGP